MSFLRKYETEMAKYTDAPAVFHTGAAYSLLGACLSSSEFRLLLDAGVPTKWTNLWVFLIGDTARSRKSTAVAMAAEVMNRTLPLLRAPDDGSPEGFLKDLMDKQRNWENRPKNMKHLKRDERPVGPASFLMSLELGAFLMNTQKDYAKPIKGQFMELFDVPATYTRRLSKEKFSVNRPRLSILGGIATELLPNLTEAQDWLGGFMNRALLIPGRSERKLERAGTPPEVCYIDLSECLFSTLQEWKRTRIAAKKKMPKSAKEEHFLVPFTDDALKEFAHLKKACQTGVDLNVDLLRGRADLHFQKLCAIEQVSADPSVPEIRIEAVRAAWPLFKYWWDQSPEVMDQAFARSNADVQGDRLSRRLLRVVRAAGDLGVRESDAMRSTVLDTDRFQNAVSALVAANYAERFDAGDNIARLRVVRERAGDLAFDAAGNELEVKGPVDLDARRRRNKKAANPMSLDE